MALTIDGYSRNELIADSTNKLYAKKVTITGK